LSQKIGPKRYLRELAKALHDLWKEGARWIGYAATFAVPVLLAIVTSVLARFGIAIEWVAGFTLPELVAGFGVVWLIFSLLVFAPYEVWRRRAQEIDELRSIMDDRRNRAHCAAAIRDAIELLRPLLTRNDAQLRNEVAATMQQIVASFRAAPLKDEHIMLFQFPVRPTDVVRAGYSPEANAAINRVYDRIETLREILPQYS
jgi:hypothetical protein